MKIRGAIGLGITIIVLKFLMSSVFGAFEDTLIHGFSVANIMIDRTGQNVAEIGKSGNANVRGGIFGLLVPQVGH